MAEDVDFFINKLQKVDGFGDTGDFLMSIVKSKAVATTSSTTANGTTDSNTEEKTEPEKKTSSEERAED
jgi:vacuolar protein sorting-associated protein 54